MNESENGHEHGIGRCPVWWMITRRPLRCVYEIGHLGDCTYSPVGWWPIPMTLERAARDRAKDAVTARRLLDRYAPYQ